MRQWKVVLAALLLAGFFVTSLQATVIPFDTWEDFTWNNVQSVPFLTTPSFTFTANRLVRVDITDRGITGDRFTVNVNTVPTFTTPAVVGGLVGSTEPFTGDGAWQNGTTTNGLSKGSFLLGPGSYQLDIYLIAMAPGFDFGGGFVRIEAVPEPATFWLIGAGLLVGSLVRRRVHA